MKYLNMIDNFVMVKFNEGRCSLINLCFVVLFGRISDKLGILYFHGFIIINTDNSITYNRKSHEFLTTTSYMFINKLSRMLCNILGWKMFETEVELLKRYCKPGSVKLVMLVYQFVVMGV